MMDSSLYKRHYDVFISYARWDFAYAKNQIELVCKSLGISCFYDSQLRVGEDFTSQITGVISNSGVVVLFYSHDLVGATWNKHELNYAESIGKPIVLVNLERDNPRGWYATHFKQKYIQNDDGKGIAEIVAAVRGYINNLNYTQSSNCQTEIEEANDINVLGFVVNDEGTSAFIDTETVDSAFVDSNADGSLDWDICDYGLVDQLDSEEVKIEDAPISYSIPSQYEYETRQSDAVHPTSKKKSIWHRLFGKEEVQKNHVCDIKFTSSQKCTIYKDGQSFASLENDGFCSRQLDRGEYILKFVSEDKGNSYTEVLQVADEISKAIIVKFPITEKSKKESSRSLNCFIAGSTGLKQERRSFCYVMSRIHNQWSNRHFSINSYSYEDFPRSVHDDGQQGLYNEFIRNKADIIMFVFDNQVGDITLDELNVAIDSFQKKHMPQIYVYSKSQQTDNESIRSLRQRMDKLNQYWVDYKDLDDLETQFEHDMNWYLFDMYNRHNETETIVRETDNVPF